MIRTTLALCRIACFSRHRPCYKKTIPSSYLQRSSQLRLASSCGTPLFSQTASSTARSLARPSLLSSTRIVLSRYQGDVRLMSALKSPKKPIRILWGSQGGTAQIFAMQLMEALEDRGVEDVHMMGLDESPPEQIMQENALNIFVVSVTGTGEPPSNTRAFFESLMNNHITLPRSLDFAIFGLGNSLAHKNHFNVIGKAIDSKLEALGGNRVHELYVCLFGNDYEGKPKLIQWNIAHSSCPLPPCYAGA
jgi:sulfite reductase alpha subunit-like flavoprotein